MIALTEILGEVTDLIVNFDKFESTNLRGLGGLLRSVRDFVPLISFKTCSVALWRISAADNGVEILSPFLFFSGGMLGVLP